MGDGDIEKSIARTWGDRESVGRQAAFALVRGRDFIYGSILVVIDCAAILLAFIAAFYLRAFLLPVLGFQTAPFVPLEPYLQTPWMILLWPAVFYYEGLYERGLGTWDEQVRLVKGICFGGLLAMGVTFVTYTAPTYSRAVVIGTALLALPMVPLLRMYCKSKFLTWMFPIRIVLFTGGEPRAQLKTQTTVLSKLGYDTLRVVPLKGDHEESTVHGVILDRTLELNPDQIFLQQEDFSGETFRNTLRAAESTGRPVRVFSTLSIFQLRANIRNLDGLILYDLNSGLGRPFSRIVKRTMDVVGAAVLLILLAPLFPILGILIRLDSPGPIFFRHRRLDSRGRIFRCWKFRTMYPDAEERLRNWMENGDSRVKEFDTAFKLKDDPRITRIGKILRRTSLDELPQLFNVLCGQMSLVGPRPIVSEETAKYGSDFQYLLMAKGGMTGISQVSGRNDLDYSERIALDCFYVRNWSIWADIVILLKTLGAVLTRSGAY